MNAERLFALYDHVADAPDAVDQLRRFVLDLAVRGRLVEQDPADEPASELLKRIAAEKARLVEAGEIRKPKRMPVLDTDELPFCLPHKWAWTRLFEMSRKIHYGFTASANRMVEAVRLLRITDIQDNRVDWLSVPGCEIEENVLPKFRLEKGDVLIARTGGTVGKSFLVQDVPVTAVFASYLIRIQGSHEVNDRYLKLFLESPTYWTQLRDGARGAGQPNVNGQTLGRIAVPVPPLAEQRRIVAKVDELMALCDRLEETRTAREDTRDRLTRASLTRLTAPADTDAPTFRAHARFAVNTLPALTARAHQVKHLRQTILNLAVRGELVEQDPADEPASELLKRIAEVRVQLGVKRQMTPLGANETPFLLPEGWHWSRIGELCTKTGSGSTPRGGKSVYKKTGVPFLRSQNVYDDGLRLANVAYVGADVHARMAGTAVRARDLLLNITGGSMGRCCRVPDDFAEANISQHVAIIRPAVSEMAAYLHKLVLSPHFQAFIFRKQTGAGRGGLPKNRMDRIPVAVPPLAEQRRIVARVDELMALCDRLETGLGTADDTRSRLLESILRDVLGSAQPERATDGHLGNEVHDPRVYGAGTPRQCTEPRSLSLRPIQDPNLGVTNGV